MNLVAVGLVLLALGVVVDLVLGRRKRPAAAVSLGLAAAACAVLAVVGARGLTGPPVTASLHWFFGDLGAGSTQIGTGLLLDPLAGLFLLLVCVVAVPAILVTADWSVRQDDAVRTLPAALCLMLGACALIVLAADVFVLALAWELLTAAFYWLATLQRRRAGRVAAGLATVGFGKASGAALLLGLLLLAADSGSFRIADLGQGSPGVSRSAAYVLLILAFAIKVGLAPVQVWMPRGYSASPGPARALMAGAAVNVGFYGLWRTLDVLGAPPGWLAVALLLLGGLTALLGIAHATVQTRLTSAIAYSSVENAGLIITAYAIALVGAVTNMPTLMAAGLLAATLQMIAHAVSKTLLFVSAGVIESRLGTDDIDELRGVARRLPWSGTGLGVGAFTMAGLPPTVVFVSEWFILETLMQQFRLGHLAYALPMAVAGALVALTTGFAGVAFARLAGFTVLGRTGRTPRNDPDVGVVGRIGVAVLAVSCVAVAALTPAEIHLVAAGLSGIVPSATTNAAVASPWVLGPVYRDFSALSPSWLAIELPAVLLLVAAASMWLSRGSMLKVRRVDPWRSATGGVEGADEYTPFGYANPTRKVLANVLLPRTELRALEARSGGETGDEDAGPAGTHLGYTADVVEVTEAFLYRPLLTPLRAMVRAACGLQSGRLASYLLYMLIALVALLAVVTALG